MDEPSEPERVGVCVLGYDEQLAEGVATGLLARPDLTLLTLDQRPQADVVLVLAVEVTDEVAAELDDIADAVTNPAQCMVLVADPLTERHLLRVISSGVVSVLPRRGASVDMILHAVCVSQGGGAVLPDTMTRWLVDKFRLSQQNVLAMHGTGRGGLTMREVDVLRLLAEGRETAEIAEQLNYSERTIKKVIQTVTSRLGLRNRAHAVSYALRVGAI